MADNFQPFDFHRIFFGDLPFLFFAEVIFRTIIMYSYAIILLRVLGKRGMGQLSTLEVAIIIAFGSAIGDPMVGADVPILYGITSVTVVAVFQIFLERLINKNRKIEAFMEGEPRLMVDDGVIKWDCMQKENLSREDLFRFLRDKEVEHLGQVHKALFEISGSVSVMFYPPRKIKPGLTVLPHNNLPDEAILHGGQTAENNDYSCTNCGTTLQYKHGDVFEDCNTCGHNEWIRSAI